MESLLLFCRALASPTMCRFIPALSVTDLGAITDLGASRDTPRRLNLGSSTRLRPARIEEPSDRRAAIVSMIGCSKVFRSIH